MPRTVYKYNLTSEGARVDLRMPIRAVILSVQMQNELPMMWVEVDPDMATHMRYFKFVGTGWPIPDGYTSHIATVQHGDLVWHLYEKLS